MADREVSLKILNHLFLEVLVVAGGTGRNADTAELLYQTETGKWASAWTFGPRLPRALSLARAAPLENRLLLTGGLDAQETYQDSVNQMFPIHLVTHSLLQVLELSMQSLEENYWTQVK